MRHVAWNYKSTHKDFIVPIRERLQASRLSFVIENVVGAPLVAPIRLCGSAFNLGVETEDGWRYLQRHRLFESNWAATGISCQHQQKTVGIYGDHLRKNRRQQFTPKEMAKAIGIYGEVPHGLTGKKNFSRSDKVHLGQIAMGMPWCPDWYGIKEAIPPAYTEYLGRQLLRHLCERAA
jgi:DNA (cytosine-5)-methyltransferase 1